jgi:hypothetical protein
MLRLVGLAATLRFRAMNAAGRRRLVRAVSVLLGVEPASSPLIPVVPPSPDLAEASRTIARAIEGSRTRDQLYEHETAADPAGDVAITRRNADAPLRIISDGIGANTQVCLGEHEVPGVIAVTWRLTGSTIARALIEVEGVHLTHDKPKANGDTVHFTPAKPGPRIKY